RIIRQLANGCNGRPEQGSELPGPLQVVAVDAYPSHIGSAGPPGGRARNLAVLGVIDDVDRPQPSHVLRSQGAEDSHDVPPGGHEHSRGSFAVAPGVPVTVHLVAKAQDDRVMI